MRNLTLAALLLLGHLACALGGDASRPGIAARAAGAGTSGGGGSFDGTRRLHQDAVGAAAAGTQAATEQALPLEQPLPLDQQQQQQQQAQEDPTTQQQAAAGAQAATEQALPLGQPLPLDQQQQQEAAAQPPPSETQGPRCPALSRELFMERAGPGGVAMIAVMNTAQWDFGLNWLHHVRAAGIDYYVIAAADVVTSQRLTASGEPCFEWLDEEAPRLGLAWGQEGWRRMTWSKVFVLAAVVDFGLDLVVSDVDVVWFRDPRTLISQHPDVDLIFGLDHGSSASDPGDSGLEAAFHPNHADFNTGVYTLRHGPNVSAWAHAWAASFKDCDSHDQVCCYRLIRTGEGVYQLPPPNQRISVAWHGRIRMATMPVSIFQSGHTRFVQQLHVRKQVDPMVVHATWTYNGLGGKRARLRDMGLWVDAPAYYSEPSFLTVDLDRVEVPMSFNRWNENEDMIVLHLETLRRQLQQAYVGMALATAAARPFILPKFQCFCEKTWYGTVRCRVFDAQDFPLPITCPTDYLFQPEAFLDGSWEERGMVLDVREPPFLDNPRSPEEVKSSVLVIMPSAALKCRSCVKEQLGPDGRMVVLVPPSLRSEELLPLLDPYRSYRVWRLTFGGVGSTQRAYSGFSREEEARAFDRRMAHITTSWCCRREEELLRYHKQGEIEVMLSMTPHFNYNSSFDSSPGGDGGGGTSTGGGSEGSNGGGGEAQAAAQRRLVTAGGASLGG